MTWPTIMDVMAVALSGVVILCGAFFVVILVVITIACCETMRSKRS